MENEKRVVSKGFDFFFFYWFSVRKLIMSDKFT